MISYENQFVSFESLLKTVAGLGSDYIIRFSQGPLPVVSVVRPETQFN